MTHYVYILECSDGTYYIGWTTNLEKRLNRHNHSKAGAHYTKTRRPVVLKYFEKHRTRSKALKREYELKCLKRAEKESLFLNFISA